MTSAGVVRRTSTLVVALLLVTSVLVIGIGPVGTVSGASQKADVVFVFDKTGSMDTQAAALKEEVENVANELDSSGIDARYGLITYESASNTGVVVSLTDDTQALQDGLEFSTEGGTEDASDAINFALDEMNYRSDAQKIIVVITDEDDDSSALTRDSAITNLNDAGACLVAVSPNIDSSDELKSMSERADCGDWTDIGSTSFTTVVTDLIGIIEDVTGDSPAAMPDFQVASSSVNSTTAHVGEPISAEIVVENQGSRSGSYHALITTMNEIHYSERVELAPGESHTFTPTLTFAETRSYNVRLNYKTFATIDVIPRPPAPLEAADVELVDASVPRSTTWAGDSYDVITTVENVGDRRGEAIVTFAHNVTNGTNATNATNVTNATATDTVVATESVYLDPGETADIRHTVTVDSSPAAPTPYGWNVSLQGGNATTSGSVTVMSTDQVESGLVDAYAKPRTVAPGEEYAVVALLHNPDESAQLVTLSYAGPGEDALRMVWVGPGETIEVDQSYTAPTDVASLEHQVNDRTVSVTVTGNETTAA